MAENTCAATYDNHTDGDDDSKSQKKKENICAATYDNHTDEMMTAKARRRRRILYFRHFWIVISAI